MSEKDADFLRPTVLYFINVQTKNQEPKYKSMCRFTSETGTFRF